VLGEIYKDAGKLDDAVQAYRKAIAVDPQQAVSYKALGFALMGLRKLDESAAAWQELIKVDPNDSSGPAGLGAAMMALKRYAEAETAMSAAAQLEPDSALLQFALGQAAVAAGHYEKAVDAYRKAFELSPQPMLMNSAAYALADANAELPIALEWARKAVAEETAASQQVNLSQLRAEDLAHPVSLGMFWDTLGWVYFKSGDLDRAETYLNAAWTLSQQAVIAGHLGQVYERQGKNAAAIHMYKLALNPSSSRSTGEAGHLDATRARLKHLSPPPAKDDSNSMEITSEVSAMGLTKLPRVKAEPGSAEFFLVFARDPKTASVVAEDVKFISGTESLKSAVTALKSASYKVLLPSDGQPHLLRRGILLCSPYSGCNLSLMRPEDVRSVN
jgi:tetratricopeptide (TPR) repeat protein